MPGLGPPLDGVHPPAVVIGVGSHVEWPVRLLATYGLEQSWSRPVPRGLREGESPALRVAVQREEGLDIEVLVHAGLAALPRMELRDRASLVRDFNTWLAEFVAYDPGRLVGIAVLPAWSIEAAVLEAERAASLGLRGVLIPAVPGRVGLWSVPAALPYGDCRYRPLWETIATHGLVLVTHAELPVRGTQDNDLRAAVDMVSGRSLPAETAAAFILSRVFERYPRLKLVCLGSGVAWMMQTMEWLNRLVEEHPQVFPGVVELPSVTFQRHVYGSISWELMQTGAETELASGNLMWSADIADLPPDEANTLQHLLAGTRANLVESGRTDILSDNAVAVFRLDTT